MSDERINYDPESSAINRAANEGANLALETLREHDLIGERTSVICIISEADTPEGEQNSTTGMVADFELDPMEVLTTLFMHLHAVFAANGKNLILAPLSNTDPGQN